MTLNFSGRQHRKRHGRVEVPPGDVPKRRHHQPDGQPVRQRHRHQVAAVRQVRVEMIAPTPATTRVNGPTNSAATAFQRSRSFTLPSPDATPSSALASIPRCSRAPPRAGLYGRLRDPATPLRRRSHRRRGAALRPAPRLAGAQSSEPGDWQATRETIAPMFPPRSPQMPTSQADDRPQIRRARTRPLGSSAGRLIGNAIHRSDEPGSIAASGAVTSLPHASVTTARTTCPAETPVKRTAAYAVPTPAGTLA